MSEFKIIGDGSGNAYVSVPFNDDAYFQMVEGGINPELFVVDGERYMGVPKREPLYESFGQSITDDADQSDWEPKRVQYKESAKERLETLDKIRWLSIYHPNCKRAIELYKIYIVGATFRPDLTPDDIEDDDQSTISDDDKKIIRQARKAWKRFLKAQGRWWTLGEFVSRIYRDGEQFTFIRNREFPMNVRFLDPENIDDPENEHANPDVDDRGDSHGIVIRDDDPTDVVAYKYINVLTGEINAEISAADMIHVPIDCDSNEKRGRSRLLSPAKCSRQFSSSLETEIIARKLQASIVLQRKVSGGPQQVQGVADNARSSTSNYPDRSVGREKFRPGTIINTNKSIEYEFVSPDTNFGDASPLLRQILLQICAGTGWPEHMLTMDTSNGNQASNITAEGPVDKMIEAEQAFIGRSLEPLFWEVMASAVEAGIIDSTTEEMQDRFDVSWHYPDRMARDKLKEAQTINLGIMNGSLSVAEGSRRQNVDPSQMRRERREEMEEMPGSAMAAMNPSLADKAASSGSNATQGSGTNQGDGAPISHKDKAEI